MKALDDHVKLIFAIALIATPLHANGEDVTIRSGDTLSKIARSVLGEESRWVELCELNQDVISDCNVLPAGAVLKIPPLYQSGSEVIVDKPQPQPADNDAAALGEVASPNIIQQPFDMSSEYWTGFWVKPEVHFGLADPDGGKQASGLATADAEASSGGSVSGLLRKEALAPGSYTVSFWIRSTSGEITFAYGLSDRHQAAPIVATESWRRHETTFVVEGEQDRAFQLVERTKDNAAWELYNVEVKPIVDLARN